MRDPTERFSSRVENYVKYRPGYPPGVLDLLERECGLTPAAVVADIGAGTGLLAEMFLQHGNRVVGVEPNREMREAGARLLARYPIYTAIDGRAEATGLPDASVNLVTAGQAFHWFDPAAARTEFRRILRPGGWVALVWNVRRMDASPFMVGYDHLLRTYAPEYPLVAREEQGEEGIKTLFAGAEYHVAHFGNDQHFDLAGLRGRVLSSSYVPEPGQPGHDALLSGLTDLFTAHAVQNHVTFLYDTQLYYGHLP